MITDHFREEIAELIFLGQKIAAIKRYREVTGKGLKEAKEYVETLNAQLQQESPEKFIAKPSVGCTSVILLFAFLSGLSYWLIISI
jgi:hypothetical protein